MAHFSAWSDSWPEPVPSGRVCAQKTGPGTTVGATVVWDATLEVVGLGKAASKEAQSRLVSELNLAAKTTGPASDWESEESTDCDTGSAEIVSTPWESLLPSVLASTPESEEPFVCEFSRHLVPWLDLEDASQVTGVSSPRFSRSSSLARSGVVHSDTSRVLSLEGCA